MRRRAKHVHDHIHRRHIHVRSRAVIAAGCAVLAFATCAQPVAATEVDVSVTAEATGPGATAPDIAGPLTAAINRTATSVQESLAAAQAAADALRANATDFTAKLGEILVAAPGDPQGALAGIQSAVTGELGALEATGLEQALILASRVAAPSCTVLGALTATLPSVPLIPPPYTIFGPLAGPVAQLDRGVSDALLQYYTQAFTTLLTPTTLPAGAAALQPYVTLAQTLVGLLKVNWHTTYYPPGGGAPVVRDTPALLNLPAFLDVDGRTGTDMCALMSLDLTTGDTTQSIARLPLSSPNLPLDIQSQFLDAIVSPGYETKASKAPTVFDTTLALAGAPVNTSLTQPGATFDQTMNLTSAIQFRFASAKPPATYTFTNTKPGGDGGNGTLLTYAANTVSDKFTYTASLAGLNLGVAQTPGARNFEYCTSAKGFCSNEPAADSATEKASMHFTASQPVKVDQFSSNPSATTCPGFALLGDAHLTGSRFFLGADTTTANGRAWVDTDDGVVTGCLATSSTTATLPAGFKAENRRALWSGSGNPAPATSKTGTVTCPGGTSVTGGSLGIAFGLSRYLCPFPPANTALPTVTGQPYKKALQTGDKGTWTPTAAPNTPSFAYQWQRCTTTLPTSCANIGGAAATTYLPVLDDLGKRLRLLVTATNADATATAPSAMTAVITLPPAPVVSVPPVVTGSRAVGSPLATTDGTWINGPESFAYQWRQCDADGGNCADIPGATGKTYTPVDGDKGHQIKVIVTATNEGGSGTSTSNGLFIPPPPVRVDAPVVKNGSAVASGLPVLEGDHLTTTDGTWQYPGTYAYQWLRCDALGANCAEIAGATGNAYQAGHDDIGATLSARVTTTNPNGSDTNTAAATGLVLPNALLARTPGVVPDGTVAAAAARDRETHFVGGTFDTVGPRVGGGGAVPGTPTAAGRAATLGALVSGGTVNAVASDTSGGYFLGGTFTRALGQACRAVAHVRADGSLDATYCQPSLAGEVRALDYVKRNVSFGSSVPVDVLTVGGAFTLPGGHANLVHLDSTGLASYAAGGDPDGAVNTIADLAGSARLNYFIGGEFTAIGPTPAKRLGRVAITAPPTAGTPMTLAAAEYPGGVDCAGGGCSGPVVRSVAVVLVSNALPNIVVGGTFDSVYAAGSTARVARNNAASFADYGTSNPPVGAWDPSPNGPVRAIAVNGTSVYLAGDFTSLTNGTTVTAGFKGIAEYGLTSSLTSIAPLQWNSRANAVGTGATSSPNTAWKPQVDTGRVLTMVADSTGVFLGGDFTSVNGSGRHRLAHLPVPGASPPVLSAWDPNAGRTVRALARFSPGGSGTPSIFVGGDYLVLGGETRNNIAELTPSGTLAPWAPVGVNGPVKALATAGGVLYAGGAFTAGGTTARSNLAAFDTGTGALTGWNPGADGPVAALVASGGTVYAGGAFGTAGGAGRANLAAFDGSGAATGWNPGADGPVGALAVDGPDVYAGGAFAHAGGATRADVAGLDRTTGAATAWNPGTDGSVGALAVTGDRVLLGGAFTTAGGAPRRNAAAIDRSSGSAAAGWDPQPDAPVRTLLVVGSKVFAGGDFANVAGVARSHAAQLDGSTAEATGFLPEPDGRVDALAVTPGGVLGLFGSFTTLAGGVPTSGYAFYGG